MKAEEVRKLMPSIENNTVYNALIERIKATASIGHNSIIIDIDYYPSEICRKLYDDGFSIYNDVPQNGKGTMRRVTW